MHYFSLILMLSFWLLITAFAYWCICKKARILNGSIVGDFILLLFALMAILFLQNVSWKGCGANPERMYAFHLVVLLAACLIRQQRERGRKFVARLLMVGSLVLMRYLIEAHSLFILMIYDASLDDQRIIIFYGEALLLFLCYFGWPRLHNKEA
jgi:hypothetical protein